MIKQGDYYVIKDSASTSGNRLFKDFIFLDIKTAEDFLEDNGYRHVVYGNWVGVEDSKQRAVIQGVTVNE